MGGGNLFGDVDAPIGWLEGQGVTRKEGRRIPGINMSVWRIGALCMVHLCIRQVHHNVSEFQPVDSAQQPRSTRF